MAVVRFLDRLAAIIDARPAKLDEPQGKQEAAMQVIKVRAESNPASVAGAIANAVRSVDYDPDGKIEIKVVGERATYLASLAVSMAEGFLAADKPGLTLAAAIGNETVNLSGKELTCLTYRLGWFIRPQPKEAS